MRSDSPGRNALPTGSDVNLSRGFQTTSGTDPGIASPSDVAERFVSQPAERIVPGVHRRDPRIASDPLKSGGAMRGRSCRLPGASRGPLRWRDRAHAHSIGAGSRAPAETSIALSGMMRRAFTARCTVRRRRSEKRSGQGFKHRFSILEENLIMLKARKLRSPPLVPGGDSRRRRGGTNHHRDWRRIGGGWR